MYYYVVINGNQFAVTGTEAAYAVYRKACEFAELLSLPVSIKDACTGEIIIDNHGES